MQEDGCVWGSQFLIPKSKRVAFHADVLQATAEVRRRVWRVVGVGVGLLRHDGEVEGVVVIVTIVFQVYFSAGCCDMRNLSVSFARP